MPLCDGRCLRMRMLADLYIGRYDPDLRDLKQYMPRSVLWIKYTSVVGSGSW